MCLLFLQGAKALSADFFPGPRLPGGIPGQGSSAGIPQLGEDLRAKVTGRLGTQPTSSGPTSERVLDASSLPYLSLGLRGPHTGTHILDHLHGALASLHLSGGLVRRTLAWWEPTGTLRLSGCLSGSS